MSPSVPLESTGRSGAQLAATVFMGSLKTSELQILLLPLCFKVLMHELRVVKNPEIQGKPLLEETNNGRKTEPTSCPATWIRNWLVKITARNERTEFNTEVLVTDIFIHAILTLNRIILSFSSTIYNRFVPLGRYFNHNRKLWLPAAISKIWLIQKVYLAAGRQSVSLLKGLWLSLFQNRLVSSEFGMWFIDLVIYKPGNLPSLCSYMTQLL